jgi:hypothetical protein
MKAGLLGFGTESLNDAESNLVDRISEVVDFAGEKIVKNNGEGRRTDTKSGIDKSFGDTSG